MTEAAFDNPTYQEAVRQGHIERTLGLTPVSVAYDPSSGRISVEFLNGAALLVPARSLQGLEDASDDELAEVVLLGETGLHWERRDVDFRITGLLAGVFGTAEYMRSARRGAPTRSDSGTVPPLSYEAADRPSRKAV